jgi:hypothetical protein
MSMNVNRNETAITIHKGLVTQTHDQLITPNNFKIIKSTDRSVPSIEAVLMFLVFTILNF